jgi:hypothetical protein
MHQDPMKKDTLPTMDFLSGLTEALIWDPDYDQFDLVDLSTAAITCIGSISCTERKCDNKIDEQNIAIAKSVTHELLHPGVAEPREAASQMRDLLSSLAKATLCQHEHQDQAAALSQKWYSNYEWCEPDARYAPSTSGFTGRYLQQDWGHELRQDWKEFAVRQPFRWEVNRERPRHHPSVMVESLKLQEQARLDDLASAKREQEEHALEAEREREERARAAEREQEEKAREAHQAREARYGAAARRMLAEQSAQAEEDGRFTQESEAEKGTLRPAKQFQLGEMNRHGTQTRAEEREQLRAAEKSRLENEEKARAAEEARRFGANGEAE